jgi:hypothetical protein
MLTPVSRVADRLSARRGHADTSGMERGTVRPWHYMATIAFAGICAWFVFRVGQRPPGLTYMDIAVHEVGHVLFRPFGELTMLVMGSGTQVLFPLALAAFFLGVRRDLLTGAVLLAWAGEAFGDAAIYVADAPYGELPLLGGSGEGDWTRILGPEHLSRMHLADEYARNLRVVGALLMLAAVGIALAQLWPLRHPAELRDPQIRPASAPPVSGEEMWRGA